MRPRRGTAYRVLQRLLTRDRREIARQIAEILRGLHEIDFHTLQPSYEQLEQAYVTAWRAFGAEPRTGRCSPELLASIRNRFQTTQRCVSVASGGLRFSAATLIGDLTIPPTQIHWCV